MLQLVVAGRGVSVLPDWLLQEMAVGVPMVTLSIGTGGLQKSIDLGLRKADRQADYLSGFIEIASRVGP